MNRRGFLGAVAGLAAAPMLSPAHVVRDTVPAMLTPGEVVLSRQQVAVMLELNGAKIAEAVLPHLPKRIKRHGLR